jgi:glycosyltransferase involved in cell wall biosynthesis
MMKMVDSTTIKDTTSEKITRVSDTKVATLPDKILERRGLSICLISRGNLSSIWMQHMVERVTKFIPSGVYWNWIFAIGSPDTTGQNYADLRNQCVKEAMRRGSRWVFFVDDDVFIPEFTIQKMLRHSQRGMKVISGIYYKKNENVEPVIFKHLGDGPYFNFPINDVFEIEGSGAGCMWIDLDIFKKFDEAKLPYFAQDWNMSLDEEGKNIVRVEIGEDHWLYYQAKKLGFQPYCDSSIMCDHYDTRIGKMYPIDEEVARVRGEDFRSSNKYKDQIKKFEDHKKPSIVFVSPTSISFDGDSIEKKALGGSETALIHTAKGLAKDYNVAIFCQCAGPGIYNDVLYLDASMLDIMNTLPIDILVMYRGTAINYITTIKNKLKPQKFVFWTQDYPMYAGYDGTFPTIANLFDALICVSNDHKKALMDRYPTMLVEDKIFVIENGVNTELYKDKEKIAKKKNKFYYSSTPFRGLEILIDVFPKIKEKIPDATLTVCSSMLVYGDVIGNKQYEALYEKCRKTPGVEYVNSLKQADLAKLSMESYLMLYPSIFAETNCISVEEAQTAGTPVICNDLGALKETVHKGCGIIIPGNPRNEEWQDSFVNEVVSVCNGSVLEGNWELMHKRCLEQNFDWSLSVEKWRMMLKEFIGEPSIKVEKSWSKKEVA